MILDNGCLPKLAYTHIKINANKNMSFFCFFRVCLPKLNEQINVHKHVFTCINAQEDARESLLYGTGGRLV